MATMINGCGMHIEKRHYRKGFFFHNAQKNNSHKNTLQAEKNTYPDQQNTVDNINNAEFIDVDTSINQIYHSTFGNSIVPTKTIRSETSKLKEDRLFPLSTPSKLKGIKLPIKQKKQLENNDANSSFGALGGSLLMFLAIVILTAFLFSIGFGNPLWLTISIGIIGVVILIALIILSIS